MPEADTVRIAEALTAAAAAGQREALQAQLTADCRLWRNTRDAEVEGAAALDALCELSGATEALRITPTPHGAVTEFLLRSDAGTVAVMRVLHLGPDGRAYRLDEFFDSAALA